MPRFRVEIGENMEDELIIFPWLDGIKNPFVTAFFIFTLPLDIGGRVYYNYHSNIKEGKIC